MKLAAFIFVSVSIFLPCNSFAMGKPSKYVTFTGNFPVQYKLQAQSEFLSTNPDCLHEGLVDVITGSGPQPKKKTFNENAKIESFNADLNTFSLKVPIEFGVTDRCKFELYDSAIVFITKTKSYYPLFISAETSADCKNIAPYINDSSYWADSNPDWGWERLHEGSPNGPIVPGRICLTLEQIQEGNLKINFYQ